jgi:hypothetical protein
LVECFFSDSRWLEGLGNKLEADVTAVDDMAERCDRIEAELLMRDAAGAGESKSSLEEKSES